MPTPRRHALWLALGVAAFVGFAVAHARAVNVTIDRYDQESYLAYAASQADSHFTALGSRRQMPVFPALLALFHAPGMTDDAFFARAKLVNVGLSLALSLGLLALVVRLLPRREALNVALVSIFFVLAFRAPYVQAEPLSYACIFALFVALVELWRRPRAWLAALAGALGGLGFLVKGTATLGVYVFCGALVLRELHRAVRRGEWRRAGTNLATGSLVPLAFAAVVAPYARTSKALYGSYLFDMSTRYVMWCDSWDHFRALNGKYGFWWTWGARPPAEVPSMSSYLASHSPAQIAWRTARGLAEVVGNCLVSHGYAPFFLALLAFGVALLAKNPELRRAVLRWKDLEWPGWLVLPYFAAHALALGFYGPIGAGNRFSLAMFLPATFAMTRAFALTARGEHTVRVGALTMNWQEFQSIVFAFFVLEVVTYWPVAMLTHYAAG